MPEHDTHTVDDPIPAEFRPIDEDPVETLDAMFDWLCWKQATTGERFHPPGETAVECVEVHADRDPYEAQHTFGIERGEHHRAWMDAVEFFDDLWAYGFRPVARTERHIDYQRTVNDLELDDVDWTWLQDSYYDGEVPDDG